MNLDINHDQYSALVVLVNEKLNSLEYSARMAKGMQDEVHYTAAVKAQQFYADLLERLIK
jgi:hypothetical protein